MVQEEWAQFVEVSSLDEGQTLCLSAHARSVMAVGGDRCQLKCLRASSHLSLPTRKNLPATCMML